MDIYPSIMKSSAEDVWDNIFRTKHLFSLFQIDIADGIYVDARTAQPEGLLSAFEKTSDRNTRSAFSCEFHLMVDDFSSMMPALQRLRELITIDRIIVHYEPLQKWLANQPLKQAPNLLKETFGFSFGLALNPEEYEIHGVSKTDNLPDTTNPFINGDGVLSFDCIQIMTVNPGAQGQSIIPSALDKVDHLRAAGYEGRITLDGAMNNETLPIVLEKSYLPDALCPGSYLEEDTENRLRILREIASQR